MIKECIDCGCPFDCTNTNIRCSKCQEEYRSKYQKKYQKRYWVNKASRHADYQFWKFIKTLTDDEIRALIQIKRSKMKEAGADIKQLRTYIKMLTEEYKVRNGDRIERYTEDEG